MITVKFLPIKRLKRKVPNLAKYWDLYSEKALKLFKHTLGQKAKERWEAREVRKFVERERMLKFSKVDGGGGKFWGIKRKL